MADAAATTQKKTKHGHAASQAQSTPRKVRFNVGMCYLFLFHC
jgi:mitogen-activated protein kinase 1/3